MNKIYLPVTFSEPVKEKFSALWFAQIPCAGDAVETKLAIYRVVRIIHETHEALDIVPGLKVELTPERYLGDSLP